MGSVKDLEIVKKPTNDKMGIGRFHFSDRYSVFDWGEMPDQIEGKGAALCIMGAYCFERLEEKSIKTHYRGLVSQDGRLLTFEELEKPTNILEFDLVNVFRPKAYTENGKLKYDYSLFTSNLRNYLIPLEIIYRNGLPEGSSIFKRLAEGTVTLNELGLDHYPQPGEKLSKPIFDVSTKLEETDRYVSWQEAKKMAGLTEDEAIKVKETLFRTDQVITDIAAAAGLENQDGKIELAFDHKRKLMIVDVVGTLDECRFTYQGLHVSKEIARQFYKKTKWYNDVEEAKKNAEIRGITDWRTICSSQPPKLDLQFKKLLSEMYKAAANELTRCKFFDVPSLREVIKQFKECTSVN